MGRKRQKHYRQGYVVIIEADDGECVVIHQYSTSYETLLEHLAQLLRLEPYVPKLAEPAGFWPGGVVTAILPADFLPVPEKLSGGAAYEADT